jgi:hypothetical protein
MHEMFFFFTPYFVFLSILLDRLRYTDGRWKTSLLVPGCSLLALLLVVRFSGSLEDPALCARLTAIGAPAKVCDGILAFGDASLTDAVLEFAGHVETHTLVGIAVIFPIVLLPVYVFLVANASRDEPSWKLLCAFCGLIVFSSPLFVLAVDWGRWISIHIVLLTITCSYFLRDREHESHVHVRPADMSFVHLALGVLILSSTLCWSIKYCCGDSFLEGFGPVKSITTVLRDLDI